MSNRNPVEEIKDRIDIVEAIQRFVPLKRAGRNWKGLCPFHHEKTPSFIVFPDSASFHCFGCGRSGDVFRFLMDVEGREFRAVLQDLARSTGIELDFTPQRRDAKETEDQLLELNGMAGHYFHQILTQSSAAQPARDYLEKRGINKQTIQEFLIGFAPDSWDSLTKYITDKGADVAKAASIGLLMERESGGYYDRFRKRIMFPIRDADGYIRGFGGRSIDGAEPKYLNSPESAIFVKGSMLYGIDAARQHIRNQDAVVIVEGYTDALMAHQAGFRNVVASMGTAINEKQILGLKRLTKNYTLALDADNAGDLGMLRGLEIIRATAEHMKVKLHTRDGRTSYSYQAGVSINVAELPRGKDPCDVIRENPAKWDQAVQNALPVADYAINTVASRHDLQSGSGKSAMVRELSSIVGQVADPVEQAHYIQRIAHLARVEEHFVQAAISRTNRQPRPAGHVEQPRPKSKAGVEERLLALIIKYPEVSSEDITHDLAEILAVEYNHALNAILGVTRAHGNFSEQEFLAALGPELDDFGRLLIELSWTEPELSTNQVRTALEHMINRLKKNKAVEQLRLYEYMAREAEESGDQERATQLQASIAQLASDLSRFDPRPSPLFKDLRYWD